MLMKRPKQDKDTLQKNILAELMLLNGETDMSQADIYRALGYAKDPFAQIKSGVKSAGADKLLAAVKLLREVIRLRKQATPAGEGLTLDEQIKRMIQREIYLASLDKKVVDAGKKDAGEAPQQEGY